MSKYGFAAILARRDEGTTTQSEIVKAAVVLIVANPIALVGTKVVVAAVVNCRAHTRPAFRHVVGQQIPFHPRDLFAAKQTIHVPDRLDLHTENTVVHDNRAPNRNAGIFRRPANLWQIKHGHIADDELIVLTGDPRGLLHDRLTCKGISSREKSRPRCHENITRFNPITRFAIGTGGRPCVLSMETVLTQHPHALRTDPKITLRHRQESSELCVQHQGTIGIRVEEGVSRMDHVVLLPDHDVAFHVDLEFRLPRLDDLTACF